MEKIDIKKFTSIEAGRVSIIMALYNMESLVYRAVSSVINQTYQNIEVIIIDDGSRDKGGAICDEIALEDNRVKVFHQENTGIAGAYLNAFKYVTGEYVLFVDSDDFIDPRMVEFLIETISKTDADIAQCRRKYFFDSKNNQIIKEAISFFGSRLATGIMDMVLMWFLVNFNIVNDVVAKVVVNVIVVILNYILSKLVVFKK
mgnify:CR=1 FL=1